MPAHVEAGVVGPYGAAYAQRHRQSALAQTRHLMDPGLHEGADLVVAERAVGSRQRTSVQEAECAYVEGVAGGFAVQERRVQGTEAFGHGHGGRRFHHGHLPEW